MSARRWRMSLPLTTVLTVSIAVMGLALHRIRHDSDDTRLDHGRFRSVHLYAPAQDHRGFIVQLSDAGGWHDDDTRLAHWLTAAGIYVVGVDSMQFAHTLSADTPCSFADGDLDNLGRFVQAYLHRPVYDPPLLVGRGVGAALAYASLAQAPAGTFAGALSIGFEPTLPLAHPPCSAHALRSTAAGTAWTLLPPVSGTLPWTDLPMPASSEAAQRFIAATPGARRGTLPARTGALGPAWRQPLLQALHDGWPDLGTTPVAGSASALPLTEVPAAADTGGDDRFAILLSGDGGWAGLDRSVAEALAANGVPVVGLDSLRYFWTPRTPAQVAADLGQLLQRYALRWHRHHALVIGYSQGANVLPAALNRLPAAARPLIQQAVFVGLEMHAAFEFHVGNWWHTSDRAAPTLPELDRVTIPALCLYGAGEPDSACPQSHNPRIQVQQVPGGHHFDGDYQGLAMRILGNHRAG